MTNTISRFDFEAAIENTGWESIEEGYSGRGMYGAYCIGIVISPTYAGRVRSELVMSAERIREDVEAMDPPEDGDDSYAREQEKLADTLEDMSEHLSTDNMGFDMIVYFPGFTFD